MQSKVYLWHRNSLCLQQSRNALHNMALPLISLNVDKDDKICEWVEMQSRPHCPSPIYEFIYVEKFSIPWVAISQQVWTDQVPAPCMWQDRKRRQEEMQPLSTWPSCEYALMVKLALKTAKIWATQMTDLWKQCMNCKILCLKYVKTIWNKSQLTRLLRNNEQRSKFDSFCRLQSCVQIVLHYVIGV